MAESIRGSASTVVQTTKFNGYIENPGFDNRLGSRGAVDSEGRFVMLRGGLKRGVIMTDKPTGDGKRYMVHFQFNPTSFSHASQVSAAIPQQATGAGDGQGEAWLTFAADTGQSVNFNLLFDRTFETWAPSTGTPAATQGVLVDIKTLYGLVGMYFGSDASGGGVGASSDPIKQELAPISPMQGVPVWVTFGPYSSYYGIIQSLQVTFTHFTQNMIPVRAAVSITMAVLPRVKGVTNPLGTTGSTGSSTEQRSNQMYERLANTAAGRAGLL